MIKTSEKDTLKSCIDYLQILRNQGKLLFVRNNSVAGNFMRPDCSQGYIRNNMPGSPDIFVFMNKQTIHLELKSTTGKQTPEQKEWERIATKLNHKYYTIRSLDELVKILSYFK